MTEYESTLEASVLMDLEKKYCTIVWAGSIW
jgi:hypothetical protein